MPGADPSIGQLREAYRIWDEGAPELVIELTSRSTVERDKVRHPRRPAHQ